MKGAVMAPILEITETVPKPVLRKLVGNISACCISSTTQDEVTPNLTISANNNIMVVLSMNMMPKRAKIIIVMNKRYENRRPLVRRKYMEIKAEGSSTSPDRRKAM